MKNLFYSAVAAIASLSLAAQSTGGITGKVTDSAGKSVPNVSVVMNRMDITQERSLKYDNAKGTFLQVGLHPTEWRLTVSAEGYAEHMETVKILLGDTLTKNVVLKTVAERAAEQSQGEASNAGKERADGAVNLHNDAVTLFNDKKFAEAMAKFETAIQDFNESLATLTDEAIRDEVEKNLASASKALAICQYEIGKGNSEQRQGLWLKAEPALMRKNEKTQNDAYLAQALADIAGLKGDTEAQNKYNDLVEKIEGPQAGNSFNRAVDLYNAGDLSGAKPHLKKAIEIDPKFPDSYYLIAICEFADGNLAAAKTNLQKYLELAPNGKYAKDVKDFLADSNFK